MKVLITIPHSKPYIPESLSYQFSTPPQDLKRHIDFAVDLICKIEGYEILEAKASRFIADLNRYRDDIHSDQGVIIHKDWDGRDVLAKGLTLEEIEERLKRYYDPFHKEYERVLSSQKNLFVFDCHSMDSQGNKAGGDPGRERPDICLATDSGSTCTEEIIAIFKREFEKNHYWVEEDRPYRGARAKIIQAAKSAGANAIEFEMNKSIYMTEQTLELNTSSIKKLRKIIEGVLSKICQL
ncbi:N-formylglutamate amidohydrolase [Thermodesulfobacteriota bacterium]